MGHRTQSPTSGPRALSTVAAGLIAGASALHVLWGTGSAWPARDRRELAELVAGTQEFPGATACFTVATLLGGAAAVVAAEAGGPRHRALRALIAAAFAVKGVAGITGSTRRLVPWEPSGRFLRWDRRCYGPLCVAIAALASAELVSRPAPADR